MNYMLRAIFIALVLCGVLCVNEYNHKVMKRSEHYLSNNYTKSMGYECPQEIPDNSEDDSMSTLTCLKHRWRLDVEGSTGDQSALKCCHQWESNCVQKTELKMNCKQISNDDKFGEHNQQLKEKCRQNNHILSQTMCESLNPKSVSDGVCKGVKYMPCYPESGPNPIKSDTRSIHQWSHHILVILSVLVVILFANIF